MIVLMCFCLRLFPLPFKSKIRVEADAAIVRHPLIALERKMRGRVRFTNSDRLERVRWEGTEALAPGKHTIEYDFRYDGLGFATPAFNNVGGFGRGGSPTLKVDGKVTSTQTMEIPRP